MINVEGDYDEIVRWLNDNPGPGVKNVNSHGIRTGEWDDYNQPVRMNVGLFSLCYVHPEDCPCTRNDNTEWTFKWYYKRTTEWAGMDDYRHIVF